MNKKDLSIQSRLCKWKKNNPEVQMHIMKEYFRDQIQCSVYIIFKKVNVGTITEYSSWC